MAEPPLEEILKVIVATPAPVHVIEPPILELEGAAAFAAGEL
jgi:hypothetical protein